MKKGKEKIFLGAQEIAGMMLRLNNAFHEMDVESDFYCLYRCEFSVENSSKFANKHLKKHRKHVLKRTSAKSKLAKEVYLWLQLFDIIRIFVYALFHYDYFLYIFGHGMFYYHRYLQKYQEIEFKILKKFNKKMIMWFCGSDSRAPYCDVDIYEGDYQKMYSDVISKSDNVRMIEKYMQIIDFPASSHFHTKPYIIYNCIGVPVDEKEKVMNADKENSKVCILHAPSNKKGKGTYEIRKILDEIRVEGYDFEYIEVSGMTHDKVLHQMVKADIVIDQMYSDTPMAGFATEAAINGVPVLVGGYYAKEYKNILPEPIAPTLFCEPENFKENLLKLIEDENLRKEIGLQEKKYVEENCMAITVAQKFITIFEEKTPKEFYFEPNRNKYLWGWGINKDNVIQNVSKLIEKYGADALGLNTNQQLRDEYINMYKENRSE